MAKKRTPLYGLIIVRRDEEETMLGALHIPEGSKEKPQYGTVIAVSEGRIGENNQIIPLTVKLDDHIAFHKYAGTEIKVDGEDLIVMPEAEVYFIETEEEEKTNE